MLYNTPILKNVSVYPIALVCLVLASCNLSRQIGRQANQILFLDSAIGSGHIGISIFEPATGKYLYNHNAEHYFIPASNTKLFTLYAGMKYLGDSLDGLKYLVGDSGTLIKPTGDPSFLHPDFKQQPVLDFLKGQKNIFRCPSQQIAPYGKGWAWDDFEEEFMVPLSEFPIYGNILHATWMGKDSVETSPTYFKHIIETHLPLPNSFSLSRNFGTNQFYLNSGLDKSKSIPFYSDDITLKQLLKDKLSPISMAESSTPFPPAYNIIKSQPSDSLFKPMMHRSDNFFAEQALLMVSEKKLGLMSDDKIIELLLKTDLKDIPQKPKWVDGSGLSRYNLFTPQSMVFLLNKMKTEFDWERIKNILPTGGEGTLKNYYTRDAAFIYAKTGTLSNNCSLSGFLITKRNKVLVFSIMANNYITGATPVRRAVERFLSQIRDLN